MCLIVGLVGCASLGSITSGSSLTSLVLIAQLASTITSTLSSFFLSDEESASESTLYTDELKASLESLLEAAQDVIGAFEAIQEAANDDETRQVYTEEEKELLKQLTPILEEYRQRQQLEISGDFDSC